MLTHICSERSLSISFRREEMFKRNTNLVLKNKKAAKHQNRLGFLPSGPSSGKQICFPLPFSPFGPSSGKQICFPLLFHFFGPALENRFVSRSLLHLLGPALENRRRDNAYLRTLMHGFPVGRLYPFSELGRMQDSCQRPVNYVKRC